MATGVCQPPSILLNGIFKLKHVLGRGSFGMVAAYTDARNGAEVAVKLEAKDCPFPQLRYESEILEELTSETPAPGFPTFYWYSGDAHGTFNVLVMRQVNGSSLDEWVRSHGPFPLQAVIGIGIQALDRLRTLHSVGFAYRDMKPNNFMWDGVTLTLIDFGLCKRVVDVDGAHIPLRTDKHLTGTPRFASVASHLGHEISRRDDLESLVFLIVYIANGKLPWQGLRAAAHAAGEPEENDPLYSRIGRAKASTPTAILCHNLPECVAKTLEYSRVLAFDAEPDYEYLHRLWLLAARQVPPAHSSVTV